MLRGEQTVDAQIVRKRVLLSEGSSLSARQSLTALALAGHTVDVCDPNPYCIARFSRFVHRFHRCPAASQDPWGYLDFIASILSRGDHDVLFPAHEQAFLFARARCRIPQGVGLAVAPFDSFLRVQGKAALVETLAALQIPQPESHVIAGARSLAGIRDFPVYLKLDYGTASNSIWRIDHAGELDHHKSIFDTGQRVVAQKAVDGALERSQAVFNHGALVAIHSYRQAARAVGGGDIAKLGIVRPIVVRHIQRLGAHLQWHGALSMDYIVAASGPLFIDANPRLVEPMNAVWSGVNLADALVRVSTGESPPPQSPQPEARTHMLLMGLLTAGAGTCRRRDVLRELLDALCRRGRYANSSEELLPLRLDPPSLLPLTYVLARLLASPRAASVISRGTIEGYALGFDAIRAIIDTPGAGC